jgi:hypothetical protein
MDEKYRENASVLISVLLIFLGIMLLPIGIGMCASLPDKIGLLGAALLVASALFFYSGIKQFKIGYNKRKAVANHVKQIALEQQNSKSVITNNAVKIPVNETVSDNVNNIIIASWQLTNEEWNTFYKAEKAERKNNILIEVFWILVLGVIVLKLTRSAPTLIAIAVSATIGAIYGFGKYYLTMKSIEPDTAHAQNKEIIITNNSIIINNKLNIFNDDTRWFKGIKVLNKPNLIVLEISYGWNTRNGKTFDEIRIPVNNQDTANKVVAAINNSYKYN